MESLVKSRLNSCTYYVSYVAAAHSDKQWIDRERSASTFGKASCVASCGFDRSGGRSSAVFCMGVLVVYIRKFDSRLQIEMLRDRKGKADR